MQNLILSYSRILVLPEIKWFHRLQWKYCTVPKTKFVTPTFCWCPSLFHISDLPFLIDSPLPSYLFKVHFLVRCDDPTAPPNRIKSWKRDHRWDLFKSSNPKMTNVKPKIAKRTVTTGENEGISLDVNQVKQALSGEIDRYVDHYDHFE